MKSWLAAICGLLFGFVMYGCCTTSVPKFEIKYDTSINYNRSVAKLDAPAILGGSITATGFAVTKEHIVTAGHFCKAVKEDPSILEYVEVVVLNNNDEEIKIGEAVIVSYIQSKRSDLCVLKKEKHGLVPLPVVKKYHRRVKRRDNVTLLGCPFEIFPVETKGIVINPWDEDENLVVTAASFFGFSGGPVINDNGQVIGVTMAVKPSFHHVGWSTPAAALRRFLKTNKIVID